jgi:ankyrin repeat protein
MSAVLESLKNIQLLVICLIVISVSAFSARAQRGNDVAKRTGKPSELVKSVESNNFAEFQRLLGSDVDVDELHYDYQTALMTAAQQERTEFVKELLKAGADVNKKNSRGWTALIFAAQRGNAEIVKLLVDAKADVNIQEETLGYSVLMWAALEGNLKTIETLLDAGANLHQKDKYGNTAFLLAAQGGKPGAIKKFLSLGFDANATDDYGGRTALIAAARSPEALKVLIEAGAKVNARQKVMLHTALYNAAQNGYTESVKVLIEAGADVNIPDFDGRTPLNRAIIGKHTAVVELLKAAGGKEFIKVEQNEN